MSLEARLLARIPNSACDCKRCRDMCAMPCWPTPDEALRLINAGFGPSMMIEHWYRRSGDIEILCAANPGYEGKHAELGGFFYDPEDKRHSGCVMQHQGLCAIHCMKPLEGRAAHHTLTKLHRLFRCRIAVLWKRDKGRVLAIWRGKGYQKP